MAKRATLWTITRSTEAKHAILRKYLDAWLPILSCSATSASRPRPVRTVVG